MASPNKTLLSLPAHLLIEHILSRLQFPSLLSCLLSCRDLYNTITASPLLNYLRELDLAGMVDNPMCPYELISLHERLDMLRERERRWTHLDWAWRAVRAMPGLTSEPNFSHSGIVCLGIDDAEENTIGLLSTCLPSKATGDVEWVEITMGKPILALTLAIEEHDMLVCVTSYDYELSLDVHLTKDLFL